MVDPGETLHRGIKWEYEILQYETVKHRLRELIDNEKVALGQLAAQFKYVSELLDDVKQIELDMDKKDISQLLVKALRIWNHVARTEAKEYRAEQKILNEYAKLEFIFELAIKKLEETEPKKYARQIVSAETSRDLLSSIKKILGELSIIENNMVKAFSRYEGSVRTEINQLGSQRNFVRHLHQQENKLHSVQETELRKLLDDLDLQLKLLKRWISGAITCVKNLMSLGTHLPDAMDRLQQHWGRKEDHNGLKLLRSKASI